MSHSPPTVSPEEQEQILQTIEMFEVIIQANPQDCQSMDILKDAYSRLGMKKEMLGMGRRLAQTLSELGQFSSAMLEYENILKADPDNVEVIAAMGELEERMHKAAKAKPKPSTNIEMDYRMASADTGTLMTTSATLRPDGFRHSAGTSAGQRADDVAAGLVEDGNEALAKFLVQHRLATDEVVHSVLERVQKKNEVLPPGTLATSLIDEIVRRGGADLEAILCGILERTKFAYIPLESYDVDRQIVKMLPDSITLSRLIVPFDVMSRTVMVATANPFDSLGKEAAQQLLDYNIQWHLASPESISRVLTEAYRLGSPGGVGRGEGGPPSVSAAPVPVLRVSNEPDPLTPAESGAPEVLPDTSAFRIAK
jgi:hypothetical protein